ncbi:MAG: hypothetical protein MZV64_63645 [Ignavibacteriales bacterium]|nr:hypothetical protein [Ignavibacteriales bacterium]
MARPAVRVAQAELERKVGRRARAGVGQGGLDPECGGPSVLRNVRQNVEAGDVDRRHGDQGDLAREAAELIGGVLRAAGQDVGRGLVLHGRGDRVGRARTAEPRDVELEGGEAALVRSREPPVDPECRQALGAVGAEDDPGPFPVGRDDHGPQVAGGRPGLDGMTLHAPVPRDLDPRPSPGTALRQTSRSRPAGTGGKPTFRRAEEAAPRSLRPRPASACSGRPGDRRPRRGTRRERR